MRSKMPARSADGLITSYTHRISERRSLGLRGIQGDTRIDHTHTITLRMASEDESPIQRSWTATDDYEWSDMLNYSLTRLA